MVREIGALESPPRDGACAVRTDDRARFDRDLRGHHQKLAAQSSVGGDIAGCERPGETDDAKVAVTSRARLRRAADGGHKSEPDDEDDAGGDEPLLGVVGPDH